MPNLTEALHKEIQEECDRYLGNVGKAQVTKIVKELLPELDNIISKHVKEHLALLGNKMVETFSDKNGG
jgi:hypothetical protein